ncbi:MAG: NAD(P)-binding protein [Acidimicrobiia bacterium]|nr:MAG: NAD(P)-binding protein [Acidimicrobiia bacterium]
MARDPRYDILFDELRIGPKTMRNRFFQAAHCSGAGSEKPGFQAALRGMKAEGGWAAVSTEYCSVSPESDDFHRVGARLWDDGDIRNLAHMVDAVHEHGALAAVELVHGSVDSPAHETRLPAKGVSATQSMYELNRTPRAMTKDDIRLAQRELVKGALRAERAGFDIITVYIAMAQGFTHHFLLPLFNNRTDEYGGSFENRARFSREVLEMIREAVGGRCAISVRFGLDTLPAPEGLGDRGIRAEGEGHEFIEYCDHLVDMWDIQLSWAGGWGEDAAPSRTHAQNHAKKYLENVKKHTQKPVMNVGRFTDPDVMVAAIRSGQCDIIGAARPSIADPFLPNKIAEGRVEDIRECIGCNACVARWSIGGPSIICTQNPTIGEEYRRGWHPERFKAAKNSSDLALVIGAGPAGLECAMVLGKRGLAAVHLVEADDDIGGSMRWISRLPGLAEWNRLVDYRRHQIEQLSNVQTVLGTRLTATDVLDYGADIVIAATGSHWALDGLNGVTQASIPGADATTSYVVTPEQVMAGEPVGDRVLVFDTDGYFTAVGIAERLLIEGKTVTYVTPFGTLAPHTALTLEAPRLNRNLRALGLEILTERSVTEIRAGSVLTKGAWESGTTEIAVDSVVLVTQRLVNDDLFNTLQADQEALTKAGIKAIYQVGDCYAPQTLAETIFHAHRLAREIDSPDPNVPLPFIRERRLIKSDETDYRLDSRAIADPV